MAWRVRTLIQVVVSSLRPPSARGGLPRRYTKCWTEAPLPAANRPDEGLGLVKGKRLQSAQQPNSLTLSLRAMWSSTNLSSRPSEKLARAPELIPPSSSPMLSPGTLLYLSIFSEWINLELLTACLKCLNAQTHRPLAKKPRKQAAVTGLTCYS